MERVQPADEWDFLPRDDELEGMSDNEPPEDQAPEAAAIHVRDPSGLTPAEDPGVADVDLGLDSDDPPPVSYFDDEQPEPGGGTWLVQPDEVEPDLEDLLESQHFAFSPEPPDGN
ncbi:MAG: hypothetical protein N2037_11775 [Acidimicrobiales bacterium]|nr:hypothetical protein [Acidimicrobiales bacterium]